MAGKSTISVTFKLLGDNKSFKELTKDADGLKKALNETAVEAAQLPKKFDAAALVKKIGGVTAVVGTLAAGFKKFATDSIDLTQTWGDQWAVTTSGMQAAYQSLIRDLATGQGWDHLIERMSAAAEAGRELARQLDELFERNVSLSYQEAEIQNQISKLTLTMRDVSKSDAERLAAAQKIKSLNEELSKIKKDVASQEAKAYRDNFKAQTHLNDEQINFLLKEYNINRDVINQARAYNDERKRLSGVSSNKSNAMYGGIGGTLYSAQADDATRKIQQLDASTSDLVKNVAEMVKLYDRSNDELVKSMVDAEIAVINVDTEINRSMVRANSTLGSLTKTAAAFESKMSATAAKAAEAATRIAEIRAQSQSLDLNVSGDLKGHLPGASTSQGKLAGFDNYGLSLNLPKKDSIEETTGAIAAMADVMGGLSGVVSNSASSWISWSANLVKAIASAVPAIIQLTAAQGAKTTADTAAATAGAASSVASIPYVGPALAVTAAATVLAAILSSISSIPKFADGGIAFGPTLGLFGEYSGASNNPEVVAPLDKLRGMLYDGSGGSSPKTVELKARGRDLYAVLEMEGSIRRRS